MGNGRNEKKRILIVEDHPVFREGLKQTIDRDPELIVCGEAADAEQALKAVGSLRPDLVLVDITLGKTNGIDLIKAIKEKFESQPVLVVSMHDESLYAERSLRAGAQGYVMKSEPLETLRAAIIEVLSGEVYLSKRMTGMMLSKLTGSGENSEAVSPDQVLSEREMEVFNMLGQGMGTRQIAEALNLTVGTIFSFRVRIKEKLHLKTSSELILHAFQWQRQVPHQ